MFFLISKLAWFLVAPSHVLVLGIVVGLVLAGRGSRPGGLHLAIAASGLLLGIGVLPLGNLLLRPLEDRFPQPADTGLPTGAVVLGGSTDEVISAARGQPTIVAAATRITAAAALAQRYPAMRLVFSGGSGALVFKPTTEAAVTRQIWRDLGVAPARITLEDRSRNTYENALFTRRLLVPGPDERWLLITSAFHMPRAMGLFRAVGFPVIAYPVDYQTTGTAQDWLPSADILRNLQRFDLALREWTGLFVYRLTGRTGELLPTPD